MEGQSNTVRKDLTDKVSSLIDTIPRFLGYFCGIIVVISILLTLTEVAIRYIFGTSLLLADEFGGYFVIAMGYFAAAVTWQERGHVRVSMIICRIPQKAVNWLRIITIFLSLVFSSIFTYATFKFIQQSFHLNSRSGSWINTPLGYIQLPMIIGISLLTIVILLDFVRALKKLRNGQNIEVIE